MNPEIPRAEGRSKMSAKVTVEDVERIAELARLDLKPEESARMLHDLSAIVEYVAELNQLNTVGVAPLAGVGELQTGSGIGETREDTPAPSLDRAAVMAVAPETDGSFFKVPKVIER